MRTRNENGVFADRMNSAANKTRKFPSEFRRNFGSFLAHELIRWANLDNRGFTMIELVLAIVVMAIALPPLMRLFSETAVTAAQVDRIPAAASLASELMEEIKSRKFDELSDKVNGNWSTTLGSDTGEGTTKANFDDVDDFNGWTQSFAAPFADYSATVSVAYVSYTDLNTALTMPSPVPNNWTPSYKRIAVTISNAALPGSFQLVTVVTEVQFL